MRPAGALCGGLLLALSVVPDPVSAQLGFFPSAPSYRHRAPRRAARPAREPRVVDEARPAGETTMPDVPLPVPRPSFPSDVPAPPKLPGGAVPAPAAPDTKRPKNLPVAPPTSPSAAQPAVPPKLAPNADPQTTPVAPSGARLGEAPGQPPDDAACPGRLKTSGVDVEPLDIGKQPDPRCTVVQAVRLSGLRLSGGLRIEFPDRPTLACVTADTFSAYVRDLLAPLAKGTYGAPVASVWTGPGLECRSRDHIFGAKLSAHGQGLAIDIAQLKLTDGRLIAVGQTAGPQDDAFQTAARAAACGYFHTALGPGTDSYHRNHWHFDLEVRGAHGDSKYCR